MICHWNVVQLLCELIDPSLRLIWLITDDFVSIPANKISGLDATFADVIVAVIGAGIVALLRGEFISAPITEKFKVLCHPVRGPPLLWSMSKVQEMRLGALETTCRILHRVEHVEPRWLLLLGLVEQVLSLRCVNLHLTIFQASNLLVQLLILLLQCRVLISQFLN